MNVRDEEEGGITSKILIYITGPDFGREDHLSEYFALEMSLKHSGEYNSFAVGEFLISNTIK